MENIGLESLQNSIMHKQEEFLKQEERTRLKEAISGTWMRMACMDADIIKKKYEL